jgi:hypothetical protein
MTVTAQVVLKLTRSCIGAKIRSEVDAVTAQEVFVLDLIDVLQVSGLHDVDLALVDKVLKTLLVALSPGLFLGSSAMVKRGWMIYDSGNVVVIFGGPAADVCACMRSA